MALRIGEWLAAWASAVVARPRLAAAATLALGALAAYYAAGNLGVNTDTANMIAATVPWRQHFNEYRDAFPLRDRNLLIVDRRADAGARRRVRGRAAARAARAARALPIAVARGRGRVLRAQRPAVSADRASSRRSRTGLAAAQPLIGLLSRALRRRRRARRRAPDACRRRWPATPRRSRSFYEELARSVAGARRPRGRAARLGRAHPGRSAAPTTRRVIALQPALDFSRMQPAAAAIADIRAIAARLNARPATRHACGSRAASRWSTRSS